MSSAFHPADEPAERLSADDMATRRDAEFLAFALARQAQRAAASVQPHGTCAYCRAPCLPQLVYCDDECRAGHEQLQRVQARQRGATR